MGGYIQFNFLTFAIVIYLFFTVYFSREYEPDMARRFMYPIALLSALILIDNIDLSLTEAYGYSLLRNFVAVAGYNLRILIIASLYRITVRGEPLRAWRFIPMAVCIVVTHIALFTKFVFWYDENGVFVRGPLAYTPHICALVYVILLLYEANRLRSAGMFGECTVIATSAIISMVAVAFEMIVGARGLVTGTMALAISFYYLHLHTDHFKKDVLTGVWNRTAFVADGRKNAGKITGIVMIDLNYLKKLNDEKGHDEGDRALRTLAEKTSRVIAKGCRLYRIGGDEFAVTCTGTQPGEIKKLTSEIRSAADGTGYSWAVGCAELKGCGNLSDALKAADKDMYGDKVSMKAVRRTT